MKTAKLLALSVFWCLTWAVTGATAADGRLGVLLQVPALLDEGKARALIDGLEKLTQTVPADGERLTAVLEFAGDGGEVTRFESALMLARWLTSASANNLRSVAWLTGKVEGHRVLPVLACDSLIVSSSGTLGPASSAPDVADPAVIAFYQAVASRRAKIPLDAVNALLDPKLELAALGRIDGSWEIAAGSRLEELRRSGEAWNEWSLSEPEQPASITGDTLRKLRWAGYQAETKDAVLQELELSGWRELEAVINQVRVGVLVELMGVITNRQVLRLENNLAKVIDKTNTVILQVDCTGGDLRACARLAGYIENLRGSGVRVTAFVPDQALSHSALVVAACEQVFLSPVAKLGGPGETTANSAELLALRPAIEQALSGNRRSPSLVMALLDPELTVHDYLQERTGQRAYFTEDEFVQRKDQGLWKRLERVETQEGFTTEVAIKTGLCDGELNDLEGACSRAGLSEVPEALVSSGLVHWVEELGRRRWVSYLLLFIGILALSMESGTPGLGIPGFVATICLGGYIWINYLNGTAEWLEILLLLCGIACLAIELLVLPGFGVFGIGGIVMIVASLILISQTFVLPQNEHQYMRTTQGLVRVLIAAAGAVSGLVVLSRYFSRTPGLKNLMMPQADSEEIRERENREALANLDQLLGLEGIAVTPLVPSGKVRIGDQLVAVVADGVALDPGTRVKVKLVQGSRVIVEPI